MCVVALLLTAFVPAAAVQPPGDSALGERLVRPVRFYDGLHHTPGTQRLLSARRAELAHLEEVVGADCWVRWNEDSRTARLVLVGGAHVATGVVADKRLVEHARDLLTDAAPLLGCAPGDLRHVRTRHVGALRVLQFQQHLDSTPVYPSFVLVTFFQRTDELVLTRLDAEVATTKLTHSTPTLTAQEATTLARAWTGRLRVTGSSTPVLEVAPAPGPGGKGTVPRLVYRMSVDAAAPQARYEVRVDAVTGAVVSAEDHIRYVDVTGNIQGLATPGALPDIASNPPVAQPLEGLQVSIAGGGSAITDSNGDFVIPHTGTMDVTLQVQLIGPWVNVNHVTGPDLLVSATATPGTPLSVVLNSTPSAAQTAQVNGFIQTNRVHDYIKSIDPTWNDLDLSFPCNTNINDNCNAFYDGSSINFFTAGGGCANSCYSNVIHHEYGHAVIDNIIPFASGSYHEGIADVLATYLSNNPTVGAQFSGGQFIRDVDVQDREYPQDANNPIHDAGLIVGGSFWDTLQALIPVLGQQAALDLCGQFYLQHMAFQTGAIDPILTVDVLTIDDDDGNVLNGTPHYNQINQGFSAHGLDAPALDFLTFNHVALTDTANDTMDYPVSVTIVPNIAASVSTVEVLYRAQSGSFITVPLQPGANPDEFTGFIPPAASPNRVEYFLRATDSAGNVELYPADGADSALSFYVGIVTVVYSEPVGSTDNGWTHVDVLPQGGQDDWHRGPPNQRAPGFINDWDPLVAYSPPNVWGNDLALVPNWNGNYRSNVNNYLESPSIDCSQHTGIWIDFKRWLTVESGQYDQARMTVNSSVVFANDFSTDHVDTAWTSVAYDISTLADNNADVRVRFSMNTDQGFNLGGWNIDDLRIVSVTESNPTVFALAAPPATLPVGATTTVPLLLRNDEPVNAYSVGATFDPAVVDVTGLTLTGSDIAALNPIFFLPNIGSDFFTVETAIDFTFSQTLPAGIDQSIVNVDVVPTAGAAAGTTTTLALTNGVGQPPVNNVITLAGGAIEFLDLSSEPMTVASGGGTQFVRGDGNGDGSLSLPDAVVALDYLFGGGVVACLDAVDVNDDGSVNLQDPVLTLAYLFSQGPPPEAPFPGAGLDPTPDTLSCP